MNSAEGLRYVSAGSKAVITISALVALALITAFLLFQNNLFPNAAPVWLDLWARGSGASQSAARLDFQTSQREALAFLNNAGFRSSDIQRAEFAVEKSGMHPREWEASQRFTVVGNSYARFSSLSNAASKLDPAGTRISPGFPPIPFQSVVVFLLVATVILLCVSVAAVEFRAADVSAAPRGMHPVMVANQTLLYVVAIMSAIMYVHLNALLARSGFTFLALCVIASIGFWLFRTRLFWRQSTFLSRAYVGYVIAAVIVIASLIAAIAKGPA